MLPCVYRDPIAHAKRQVSELDRTATKSEGKRKAVQDQQAVQEKELHFIEQRLAELRSRYEPLCAQLEEKKARRRMMQEAFERQKQEQQRVGVEPESASSSSHMIPTLTRYE
jgi:chromosome segregation ATPase